MDEKDNPTFNRSDMSVTRRGSDGIMTFQKLWRRDEEDNCHSASSLSPPEYPFEFDDDAQTTEAHYSTESRESNFSMSHFHHSYSEYRC
jgi:hypothetical protein